MIEDILNNNLGRIVISIIWGLGLACLFRKVCKGKNCIVIKAPNPEDLKGRIFKHNEECYKYDTYTVSCNKQKNIISQ